MDETRTAQRRRVVKAGKIAFNHGGSIDCRIRNFSDTGACLELESPVGVPNAFTLVIERDGMERQSYVVWRSARQIGVRFA